MDAKPLLMRLNQHFGAFCMSGERIPRDQIKSALLSISARVSKKFFSQNEHILCAIQKEVKSMKKSDSAEKIAQELEQLKGRDLLFAEAMDVAKELEHQITLECKTRTL